MLQGDWQRVAFGDFIKEEASKFVGLPLRYFHDVELKDSVIWIGWKYQTPRDVLLFMHDFYSKMDPKRWVRKVVETIQASQGEYFVITDWRFPNEMEAIKEAFSNDCDEGAKVTTVRVVGNSTLRSSHESECALDSHNFDHLIINRGTLQFLSNKAEAMSVMLGQSVAIGSLYTKLLPRIKGVCSRKWFYQVDIDDQAQELFYYALKQMRRKYDFSCTPWTFMYSVIGFEIQNRVRKAQTYSKHVVLGSGLEDLKALEDVESAPLLRKRLLDAVATLSEFDQKLFTLRHDGWKHKELAAELDINENYSRQRLYFIHRKLRVLLHDLYSDIVK